MTDTSAYDAWNAGDAYQHYMGRWSALIARRFVDWLAPRKGLDWLEVECGTGALTRVVLQECEPNSITAIDPSKEYVTHAARYIGDNRAFFKTGDARRLPAEDNEFDSITSGLVLNFLPDMAEALREMRRAVKPDGLLSFYVWDYPGGGMGFIDAFWKAAARLDPKAAELDESTRFPACTKPGLEQLCRAVGLNAVQMATLEETTVFDDFEAFWKPFTLGAGPAPGYCKSLSPDGQAALKRELASNVMANGKILLPARAWAVKATV